MAKAKKDTSLPKALSESLKVHKIAFLSPDGKDWRFNEARAKVLWGDKYKKVEQSNIEK